jgi:hypothetical protein
MSRLVNVPLASCPSKKSKKSQFRQKDSGQRLTCIMPIQKITTTLQTKKHKPTKKAPTNLPIGGGFYFSSQN